MPEDFPSGQEIDKFTGKIFQFADDARHRLARVWGLDTALQGLDIDPAEPASRGQCGVSHLWIARQLVEQGYQARFVEGELYLGGVSCGAYCWAEVELPNVCRLGLDVTSDQYRSMFGTAVNVWRVGEDNKGLFQYIKQAEFLPYANPHKKLNARCDILTFKMQHGSIVARARQIWGRCVRPVQSESPLQQVA